MKGEEIKNKEITIVCKKTIPYLDEGMYITKLGRLLRRLEALFSDVRIQEEKDV